MRLNRFLAAAGFGSRRGCEQLITEGRVAINGKIRIDLATVVLETDAVRVDGKAALIERKLNVLLFKPRGYLCTAEDTHARRTIFDLLPKGWPRIFHVGRLDRESEGLLILTNDGDLSLKLTHPRYKVEKEYEVILDKAFDGRNTPKLLAGFHIEGGRAKMESIHRYSPTKMRVVLKQGIKRQIRLMFYELGYEVETLRRIRIGSVTCEGLDPGGWRFLANKEIETLLKDGEPKAADEKKPAKKKPTQTPGKTETKAAPKKSVRTPRPA